MREAFVAKKFHPESMAMIQRVNSILANYEAQGYDLSLRQLYYQLVSQNVIANSEKEYKNLGNLVSDARLAGLVDWNMIKDRGRVTTANTHWDSVADIVGACVHSYKVDMWENQPCYVELMVEKQALEGVLEPVCMELDIPFTANKGYSSSSAMYEASKRFVRAAESGKKLHIMYLGDHDPSGIDMTRDVDDRFNLFIQTTLGGYAEPYAPDELEYLERGHRVHRLALNMDQVRKYNPPENPAKLTDTRANDYIRKFGNSSWELDAIEPSQLAKLVKDAVGKLIDRDIWDADLAHQQRGRDELKAYSDNYGKPPPPAPIDIHEFTKEERPSDDF